MPFGDFSFTLKKIKIHLPAGRILLKKNKKKKLTHLHLVEDQFMIEVY